MRSHLKLPSLKSQQSRREILKGIAACLVAGVPARLVYSADALKFATTPFVLGVASGYPTPSGMILWTRLMHESLGQPAVPVQWEVATDERMGKIVRRGTEYATAEWAHSLRIEVSGLDAGREYWYRFTAGGQQSSIGRTHTAPSFRAKPERLRVAVASCQKYETGYFTAYRHMLDEDIDLIVHVGDYIYEYESSGRDAVRGDGSGETYSLDEYRARYALYKRDLNLQAVHAAHPWLVTWDDHEVTNDYAGDSTYDRSGEAVLERRAAAYRAYYEHMPLPRSAQPTGPYMHLYASSTYGNLLQFHMLDSRQYRSPLICLDDEGPGVHCAAIFDNTRTMLGKQQEAWLKSALVRRRTRWNVLAQGTPMAHADLDPGPGVGYRRDVWDGFPAARQRLLNTLVGLKVDNPVMINGDIHAFQVANINMRANDITSPVIASEFTTTSITSGGMSQRGFSERLKTNPNILLADGTRRGYLLLEFNHERAQADLITVDTIREPTATRGSMGRYVVENGKPGPILST
jgi:alkaline phosphatase D